jgi:integrase
VFRAREAWLAHARLLAVYSEGIVLTIRRSKVDPEAAGRKVGIPYGANDVTCPVRTLQRYLAAGGIVSGFVFRAVDQKQRLSRAGLHRDSVGYIIKRSAARAGMVTARIAGHSLRSGSITQAARNGVPEYLIRRQSGHKPGSKAFDRYIRLGEMFTRNAAAGLGL